MDLQKLDKAFRDSSEVEVVRLLTCNFDLGAFSTVENVFPEKLGKIVREAIKFRTHLSVEPTTLDGFADKIHALMTTVNTHFNGSASKLCGYSGKLLTESETFLGTPDELVSFNEYAYFAKIYPWWVSPSNKVFEQYADQYAGKKVFFCLPTFDLSCLEDKKDVVSVSEDKIVLEGKITLPVIRVE